MRIVDLKQYFLGTSFSVDVPGVVPPGSGAEVPVVSGHIDLNPTVVGAGIGYRFGTAPAPLK